MAFGSHAQDVASRTGDAHDRSFERAQLRRIRRDADLELDDDGLELAISHSWSDGSVPPRSGRWPVSLLGEEIIAHRDQTGSARVFDAQNQMPALVNIFAFVASDLWASGQHDARVDNANSFVRRLEPPLRSQRDRDAIRAALTDGTIDAICSDHTPVDDDEKLLPFGEASPGATGLELLLSLAGLPELVHAERQAA